MKLDFWLIISESGAVRTYKKPPRLNYDEIAMRMAIELPDALFFKPTISAKIVIEPETARAVEITADVIEDIKGAIETAAEIKVEIVIPPATDEEVG